MTDYKKEYDEAKTLLNGLLQDVSSCDMSSDLRKRIYYVVGRGVEFEEQEKRSELEWKRYQKELEEKGGRYKSCVLTAGSSRICERGTKTCNIEHKDNKQ